MRQLTQKLGSGEMKIQDVPQPQLGPGMLLVQNHYSIISAGTEGSTVSAARKSLIGKAKERPQQVKQVIDVLKKQGPIQTYRAINKKLDSYSPLGYSSSGVIIGVGNEVRGYKVGDYVACAGVGYANHAEVVAVPVNLCVRLEKEANLRDAAYNTLGAISMQGVRQADLRLGETCVIVGLGLLGQLASLILRASGVEVIGIDIDPLSVDFALKNKCVDHGFVRNSTGIEDKIDQLTGGHGADAVIISAATSSLDPINFAGAIARKKGKVVVLGAVPTGFDRDPFWYRKELELKMACSYGPGRYDLNYEEKGHDYPFAYVRWTEKRNMEAFQRLLSKRAIDISFMSTHEFAFERAPEAYDLIIGKNEPFIGLVLRYDSDKKQESRRIIIDSTKGEKVTDFSVSFIGAGSYAQGNLLPNIPGSAQRVGVMTNSGTTSKRVAEKFAFEYAASEESMILNDKSNTLFIATRHDSHGDYVLKGLESDKHVFVEKPLCLNETELSEIRQLKHHKNKAVMVGFNRRFSPFAKQVKKKYGSGMMSMIYRVNAGKIPADSWIQDREIGGGRLVGEVCHFIDFLTFLNGSLPIAVSAQSMDDSQGLNDSINISLKFANGSIGVVSYLSNGGPSLAKEYVEINCSGSTAVINDFKELKFYGRGKPQKKKLYNQDKGQKDMVKDFVTSLSKTGEAPISFEEIYVVTLATFKALDSINHGGEQRKLEF